jgi:hypothetical protein
LLAVASFAADFPSGVAGEHGGDKVANAGVVIDQKNSGLGYCSRWQLSFRNTQGNLSF